MLYCTWYVFICTQSVAAAAAAALCCYTGAIAAAAGLPFPAAVCYRVPDSKICCPFIESDPGVFFLFIQARFIFNAPLGSTIAFMASICLHYGHARSQGGRQAFAAKDPRHKIK